MRYNSFDTTAADGTTPTTTIYSNRTIHIDT